MRSRAASRAWSLLRLALPWATRGGVLKCRLLAELRHVPRHFKALHKHSRRLDAIHYMERQLSFDDTPINRIGMSRLASLRFKMPSIPCIKPTAVDFGYQFGDEDEVCSRRSLSFLDSAAGRDHWGESTDGRCDNNVNVGEGECDDDHDEEAAANDVGINEKADEFIARFYQQMKLQRQNSYQEYQEMLSRGAS